MSYKKNLFIETKTLLWLLIPLTLGQLVETGNGFISTFLIAHLGAHALAAGGLVTSLFFTLMVFMWGILIAISALVAQRHGAKDSAGIAHVINDGFVLATLLTVPAMLLLWYAPPLLLLFGQEPSTVQLAHDYLHGLVWCVLPDFYSLVIIQFILGLGHARITLLFNIVWIPITLLISYGLMFGKWRLPELGIAGCGWGLTIGMWITTLLLLMYVLTSKTYRAYLPGWNQQKFFCAFRELLKTGLPLAGMFSIEVSFFMAVVLLMGHINNLALAGNQIVMQYIGLLVGAISFCMAQAITVRVGYNIGAGNIAAIKNISYCGMALALAIMLLVSLCYWILPETLIAFDLNTKAAANQMVVHYAKQFFVLAGIFQLCETVRIAAFGALRGMNDTRFTMLTSLLMFWVIAFPLGYFLAINCRWGGVGVWWGMIIGACCGATLLIWRLQIMIKKLEK
jgi:MATE family multidrug resistance protein